MLSPFRATAHPRPHERVELGLEEGEEVVGHRVVHLLWAGVLEVGRFGCDASPPYAQNKAPSSPSASDLGALLLTQEV